MKVISSDLIKDFKRSLCKLVHAINFRPSAHHLEVGLNRDGLSVYIVWNKTLQYESEDKPKRMYDVFKEGWNKLRAKYLGKFDSFLVESCFVLNTDGEFYNSYSISINIEYTFSKDVMRCPCSPEYINVAYFLLQKVRSITGEATLLIEDKGGYCTIGKYIQCTYFDHTISSKRYQLSPTLSKELSLAVYAFRVLLSKFDVPLKSVVLSLSYIKECKDGLYLYQDGDEFVFWWDLYMRGEVETIPILSTVVGTV